MDAKQHKIVHVIASSHGKNVGISIYYVKGSRLMKVMHDDALQYHSKMCIDYVNFTQFIAM